MRDRESERSIECKGGLASAKTGKQLKGRRLCKAQALRPRIQTWGRQASCIYSHCFCAKARGNSQGSDRRRVTRANAGAAIQSPISSPNKYLAAGRRPTRKTIIHTINCKPRQATSVPRRPGRPTSPQSSLWPPVIPNGTWQGRHRTNAGARTTRHLWPPVIPNGIWQGRHRTNANARTTRPLLH